MSASAASSSSLSSQHAATDQLYMQIALRLAAYALDLDEVPVACLIVCPVSGSDAHVPASNGAADQPSSTSSANSHTTHSDSNGSNITSHRSFFPTATDSATTNAVNRILCTGINATNATKNATRHCEMLALDALLIGHHSAHGQAFNNSNTEYDLADCTLYVTVEPCIMCASALLQAGVGCIVYGAANERFGGMSGAVMKLQPQPSDGDDRQVPIIRGGVCSAAAVNLLQEFYRRGNPNAPDEKRTRPLVERPRSAALVQQPQ